MAKQSNENRRVQFKQGGQLKFLEKMQLMLGISREQMSALLGISSRTLHDWKREKFLMTEKGLKILLKKAKQQTPLGVKYLDPYWYVIKGARNGGIARYKKYGSIGDPEYRKKRWFEWWNKTGKFTSKFPMRKLPFSKPKPSLELAEFCGIMMGDGSITPFQVCVTLHHIDDLEFSKFVARLMKKLFKVEPKIYHRPQFSVRKVVISRSGLVNYLLSLGLVLGNKVKQNFDIPQWIKDDDQYLKACIRGLVDTDGCVFPHSYISNGKQYSYTKLAFTSMSVALRSSVYTALQKLGFHPRLAQRSDVRLDSKADIKKYFQIIGSHNQKHLKKLPH